jgi:hypothetical protein
MERYGVCSNYLESLNQDDEVQMFIRNAPGFHMPKNNAHSMILIGPGKFHLNKEILTLCRFYNFPIKLLFISIL